MARARRICGVDRLPRRGSEAACVSVRERERGRKSVLVREREREKRPSTQLILHFCRSWVMRRRSAIRCIKFEWPWDENLRCDLTTLLSVLVASLAEHQLQEVRYNFNCDRENGHTVWKEALLPFGPCGLCDVSIQDCSFLTAPAALTSLAASLTSLELTQPWGLEVEEELPGLARALRSLTNLQHLRLGRALLGPGEHRQNVFVPPGCSKRKRVVPLMRSTRLHRRSCTPHITTPGFQ